MNTNSEPESQPVQPKPSSQFGLVSSIIGLLTIVYAVMSLCDIVYDNFTIVSLLSAIAILMGGIDLYLRSRKIPIGPILALITILTQPDGVLEGFWLFGILYGLLYAINQIYLVIKNDEAKLARLGIALALSCIVFLSVFFAIAGMIIGM